MTLLPPPEVQAADALDRFRAWWRGLDEVFGKFDHHLDAEQIRVIAEAAYCQGQIDGAAREARVTLEAFDLDACRWCGAPLPPNPVPHDPVVAELGQLCGGCLTAQADARDMIE